MAKHFLNAPATLVHDALAALPVLNPRVALDAPNRVVHIAHPARAQVALVCGGGAGHEPAHSAFVGQGMLAAAVCGSVFASPSASQVRRAIDLVHSDAGTLIVVKNYTGDVLNFGLAKEQYAALHPERSDRVRFLIVGDDVAVGREQGTIVGRRGLAGVCLVYKIAGALAARGASLDDVYAVAEHVASRLGTIGVGLEHCHVPGTGIPNTRLGDDELEIGLGIHNESGHRRISPVPPLNELIPNLIQMITSTTDPDRSFVPFKNDGTDRVVLLVNNLGGVSELELAAVVGEAKRALDKQGIKTMRVLAGSFMTSLNMPGFSLTLLLLPGTDSAVSADLVLSLLDDHADAPGWKWSSKTEPKPVTETAALASIDTTPPSTRPSLKAADAGFFEAAIRRACIALVAAEPEITDMDKIAGDGDCGLTLSAGASGVLQALDQGVITGTDVIGSMIAISNVAEENMGGTSGALYSIFFSALAQALGRSSDTVATGAVWSGALESALSRLYTYTRARPPSRTLIDPLTAFVDALPSGLGDAVVAAQEAAEGTRDVEAKAGRSAYVEGEWLRGQDVPDPGAWGVKAIVEALYLSKGSHAVSFAMDVQCTLCPPQACPIPEFTAECTDQCLVVACDDPEHGAQTCLVTDGDTPCDGTCTTAAACNDCPGLDEILQCCTDYHHYLAPMPDSSLSSSAATSPSLSPFSHAPSPFQPFACMWANCGAAFNTLSDLVGHVNLQHLCAMGPSVPVQSHNDPNLSCHWGDCGMFPSLSAIPSSSSTSPDDLVNVLTTHLMQDHLGINYSLPPTTFPHPQPVNVDVHQSPILSDLPSHDCSGTHACKWKACTLTFPSCDELTSHIASVHIGGGRARYECFWEGCNRHGDNGFTSKQKISRHLQSHTGHRPFQCQVCNQNFSEAATLQQHMRRHTQEKPYGCDSPGCGKAFATMGALTIHKRIHNGLRPFKCKFCDKAFSESSNLSKHARTHTGARPYLCTEEECNKAFARPDQLARHMKVHRKKDSKG